MESKRLFPDRSPRGAGRLRGEERPCEAQRPPRAAPRRDEPAPRDPSPLRDAPVQHEDQRRGLGPDRAVRLALGGFDRGRAVVDPNPEGGPPRTTTRYVVRSPRVVSGSTYQGASVAMARTTVRASLPAIAQGRPRVPAASYPCTFSSPSNSPEAVATSSVTPEYHGNGSVPSLPWVVATKLETFDRSSSTRSARGRSRRSRTSRRFSSAMPAISPSGTAAPDRYAANRPDRAARWATSSPRVHSRPRTPRSGSSTVASRSASLRPARSIASAAGPSSIRSSGNSVTLMGWRSVGRTPACPDPRSWTPRSANRGDLLACSGGRARTSTSAVPRGRGHAAPRGRGLHLDAGTRGGPNDIRTHDRCARGPPRPRHPRPKRPRPPSSARRTAARSWFAAPTRASHLGAFGTAGPGSRPATRGRSRSSARTTARSRSR